MDASALPNRPVQVRRSRAALRLLGDKRLVELVRSGDPAAFEVLYDRHSAKLLSFCRHMVGSKHDAEDALQRTFASAYRALLTDSRAIELRPWLFAIARNECISVLRQRHTLASTDSVDVATDGLAARVERREELRNLLEDLRELPERQRSALLLSELGGLSHAQIAQVVGVRPDQVKAYVFQARSNLIAEREARERGCVEVREELASARGAALLRGGIRRHLRRCSGCREYSRAVSRQRRALAVVLPVAPSLALRGAVLRASLGGAHGGGSASAGGGAGLLVANAGGKALLTKALAAAVVAGLGAGAGTLALRTAPTHHRPLAASRAAPPQASSGPTHAGRPAPTQTARRITMRADRPAPVARAVVPVTHSGASPAPVAIRRPSSPSAAYAGGPGRAPATAASGRPSSSGTAASGTSLSALSRRELNTGSRGHLSQAPRGVGARPRQGVETTHASTRRAPRHGPAQHTAGGHARGRVEMQGSSSSNSASHRSNAAAGEHGAAPSAAPTEGGGSTGSSRGGEAKSGRPGSPGASGSAPGHN